MATFPWITWQHSHGLRGNIPVDWVAEIRGIRNSPSTCLCLSARDAHRSHRASRSVQLAGGASCAGRQRSWPWHLIVLIYPGPPQEVDCRHVPEPAGRWGVIESVEQLEAVAPNPFGIGRPLGLSTGQAPFLDAEALTFKPLRRDLLTQPLGGDHRESIQGRAQGFTHTFQTVQGAAPRVEETARLEALEERVEEDRLRLPSHESCAKFRED